jgi:hypothetical protein
MSKRAGRLVRIAGFASPQQPGMPGMLEVYSRERFDWFRFARVRFDARSRVHFTLLPRRRLDLRLVLLHTTAGLVGGTSNVVSLLPRRRSHPREKPKAPFGAFGSSGGRI